MNPRSAAFQESNKALMRFIRSDGIQHIARGFVVGRFRPAGVSEWNLLPTVTDRLLNPNVNTPPLLQRQPSSIKPYSEAPTGSNTSREELLRFFVTAH